MNDTLLSHGHRVPKESEKISSANNLGGKCCHVFFCDKVSKVPSRSTYSTHATANDHLVMFKKCHLHLLSRGWGWQTCEQTAGDMIWEATCNIPWEGKMWREGLRYYLSAGEGGGNVSGRKRSFGEGRLWSWSD